MSDWFRRDSRNIKTFNKRDTKEGMWYSCPKCRVVIYKTVLQNNHFIHILNGTTVCEYSSIQSQYRDGIRNQDSI